jgi:hypothetical protein
VVTAALTAAGFARLTALAPRAAGALCPDGIREREQRRTLGPSTTRAWN